VLAYSEERERAAQEILRVARPGATVAIGVEWNPRSDEEIRLEAGYHPGSSERVTSTDEILALFGPAVESVLVRQDAPAGGSDTRSLVVLFRTRRRTT
jgi:hypothetical protein